MAKYRLTAKFAQVITLPKNKIIVSGKLRKSLLIALIAELCFIAFSLVFGFWGHYKSLGIEISVHVMLIVVSFLTVFLSLTWYKTKSIFFRFLHLLFVSLCLALLGTLLFLLLHEVFSRGFQHIGWRPLEFLVPLVWYALWLCTLGRYCCCALLHSRLLSSQMGILNFFFPLFQVFFRGFSNRLKVR